MTDSILSVLVVEDDPTLQGLYIMILSSQGFRVASASNGIQALAELKKHEPDVMLLDYFMPQMDGKTFLMNFDAKEYPHVKIIVASNISEPRVLEEMISLGAHSYVLKADLSPMSLIDLVQASDQQN